MRAVFLDRATVDANDLDFGALEAAVRQIDYFDTCGPDEAAGRLADADIVITNKVPMDATTLAAAPNLKLICLIATGTDNVDTEAARAHDVAVCNIRDYCSNSVAQHVFAMILSLNRHLKAYGALLRSGAWMQSPQFCMLDYRIDELDGKVLGIVGYGVLGRAVARVGRAFGMQIVATTRDGRQPDDEHLFVLSLPELLATADVVSLHCPLTEDTRCMINADTLATMKPDALLINTARGGLIDSKALINALNNHTIGGAGIDVLSQEPPRDYEPLLDHSVPRLIVTPHIAWASLQARQNALNKVAENICAFARGESLNRVV
ncbi:MAG: D-2-hydroxyacid dehydrogenase [Gammaproteobacteria bacterium]|nr:D-2-hydroxyacid dehydrogenase [Gammaproteobacteria bacterium]